MDLFLEQGIIDRPGPFALRLGRQILPAAVIELGIAEDGHVFIGAVRKPDNFHPREAIASCIQHANLRLNSRQPKDLLHDLRQARP